MGERSGDRCDRCGSGRRHLWGFSNTRGPSGFESQPGHWPQNERGPGQHDPAGNPSPLRGAGPPVLAGLHLRTRVRSRVPPAPQQQTDRGRLRQIWDPGPGGFRLAAPIEPLQPERPGPHRPHLRGGALCAPHGSSPGPGVRPDHRRQLRVRGLHIGGMDGREGPPMGGNDPSGRVLRAYPRVDGSRRQALPRSPRLRPRGGTGRRGHRLRHPRRVHHPDSLTEGDLQAICG